MITFAPFPETDTLPRVRPRLHWLPLVLLTAAAVAFTTSLPGWARMWLIAFALFAGFKWWTFRKASASTFLEGRAPARPSRPALREAARTGRSPSLHALAFLLLWPGMNARAFLYGNAPWVRATCCPDPAAAGQEATPKTPAWLWALAKTLLGATLLFLVARHFGHGLLAGWIGMVGFIFLLHFGLFALLALFWQSRGIDAPPLMKNPIAATSLHDFWGRRWNAGFRDIVFVLFFFPLARRYGTRAAALATFILSGLIHELVITVPAGAGYGLPTLYFALQGFGLMLERKTQIRITRTTRCPGARSAQEVTDNVRNPAATSRASTKVLVETPGQPVVRATPQGTPLLRYLPLHRLLTLAIVVLPIGALFPPVFVLRVMVPFFQLIHAL